MVYRLFDKKTSATHANKFAGSGIKQLAEELQKLVTRKFKKRIPIFYR